MQQLFRSGILFSILVWRVAHQPPVMALSAKQVQYLAQRISYLVETRQACAGVQGFTKRTVGNRLRQNSDSRCNQSESVWIAARITFLLQRVAQFQPTDGVGCEGCHGGSEKWIKSHTDARQHMKKSCCRHVSNRRPKCSCRVVSILPS